jgi:acyl transferase domain-containing protein
MYQMYSSLEADLTRSSVMALSSYGAIANRISYWFGLSGPSIAIDTMCSSAMTAVHLACGALSKGECRMAIAGGVNLSIHPRKYIGLSQRQLIGSNPERRSFAEGDGFLPAEAVGAVLLKPLTCALEDGDEILAVIKATAGNHSGRAGGFAVPSVVAQQKLIEELLELSGVHPRTISYVEAAANGTALSDAAEVTALSQAFARLTSDRQFCAIGSVKSVIGHPEAASGMAQLIKVVLQLRHAHLTPTIKSDPPNPHIDFEDSPFYLQHELTEWRRPKIMLNGQEKEHPRRAIINSIGAGGSNAGMLIEEYIGSGELSEDAPEPADGQYAMVFSAKTPERLQVHVRQMLRYMKEHEELSLARMAYTLQNGREAMDSRLAFVVNNRDELIRAMEMYLAGAVDRDVFGPSFALYIGEVLRERSEIDDFTEGEMGENIVRMLLARRDLPKLALLWSRGVDVPWASLYSHRRLRLAELPTYPFARERCWPSETQIAEEPVPEVEPASHHDNAPATQANRMEAARSARSSRSELPRTDLERAVARVWEEVLGISGVRIRDNFLDLGGSSLTGGQIITRLRELFGVEIPMRAMIGAQPTVESLAVEVVAALLNARENSLSEQNAQAVAGD